MNNFPISIGKFDFFCRFFLFPCLCSFLPKNSCVYGKNGKGSQVGHGDRHDPPGPLFHLVFGDAFVVLREQVAGVFEISLTLALF